MSHLVIFWATFAPVIVAVVLSLVLEMFGLRRSARWLAAALLLAAAAFALWAGWSEATSRVYDAFAVGHLFSTLSGFVFLLSGLAVLAASDVGDHSSPALFATAAGGAAIAATSLELVAILIGIEIAALSAYALVSLPRTRRSSEAAVKYFVQGAIATGLFVLGTAILVGLFSADSHVASIVTGITMTAKAPFAASFGVMMLVAALAFKSGAAPFHSWAPDAYENSNPSTAALLAGPIKLGMLSTLAVLVLGLASAGQKAYTGVVLDMFSVIGALAILSVVVGSTIALKTRSFTRMLAYAGVAQVGYALIALGSLNPAAAVLFTATYAVGTSAAFLAAEAFSRIDPNWDGTVAGLAGMGNKAPVISAALSVAMVSLAGIPPLLGFWGKLQAFAAAIRASLSFGAQGDVRVATWLAAMAAVGIIGSVVSLGYYGNVIRMLYFGPTDAVHDSSTEAGESDAAATTTGSGNVGAIVVLLSAALIALGILPLIIGLPAFTTGFLLN